MKPLIARPRLTVVAWLSLWGVMVLLMHVPLPHSGVPRVPYLDKVAHFGLYFALSFLGAVRLVAFGSRITIDRLILWGGLYGVYGAIDELTQPWTHRTADLNDWLADAVGIASATWIAFVILRNAKLSAPKVAALRDTRGD